MLKSKAVSKSREGLPTKRRETVKLLTLINKKNIAMLKKKLTGSFQSQESRNTYK